jgi:hypothetical protein
MEPDRFFDNVRETIRSGDLRGALTVLKSGIQQRQTAWRWTAWGTVQHALGDLAAAEYGLRTALQFEPYRPVALKNLASLLAETGREPLHKFDSYKFMPFEYDPGCSTRQTQLRRRKVGTPNYTAINDYVPVSASQPDSTPTIVRKQLGLKLAQVQPAKVLAITDTATLELVRRESSKLRRIDAGFQITLVALGQGENQQASPGWYPLCRTRWIQALARISANDLIIVTLDSKESLALAQAAESLVPGVWLWLVKPNRDIREETTCLLNNLASAHPWRTFFNGGIYRCAKQTFVAAAGPRSERGLTPVFVHAMWRTGSTYIWKKFRDQGKFRAYYEPFNEALLTLTTNEKTTPSEDTQRRLRHPRISLPYFAEYPLEGDCGVPELTRALCYDRYCLDPEAEDVELTRYLQRLILEATNRGQRPVFQFNRSLMRTAWIRRHFRGPHFLVLRDPREVWASFQQQSSYFMGAICLILAKNGKHRWLSPLVARWPIPHERHATVGEDFVYYRRFAESIGSDGYSIFHAFYMLGSLLSLIDADVVIDVNRIAICTRARRRCERQMREWNIDLPLSDCSPALHSLSASEGYATLEAANVEFLRTCIPPEIRSAPIEKFQLKSLGHSFRKVLEGILT